MSVLGLEGTMAVAVGDAWVDVDCIGRPVLIVTGVSCPSCGEIEEARCPLVRKAGASDEAVLDLRCPRCNRTATVKVTPRVDRG